MPVPQTLAFVTTAFNEADNLEELHRRCREAFQALRREFAESLDLRFRFVVSDNASTDSSLVVLESIRQRDPAVIVLANFSNYGPQASSVNALVHADGCDLIVLMCSDLQDPPELVITMARTLLQRPEVDAVLALKKRYAGSPLLRLARRVFYLILGFSSRQQVVPSGFHGFGCYRQSVVHEALHQWNNTDQNFRQSLVNATHSPVHIQYDQAERMYGTSSYRGWGYWFEGIRALLSGDAAASRLALMIGGIGLLLAMLLGCLLLFNFLRGNSGYGGGVPTVMALVLVSFAVQMLMFSLLSRQIEALRMGGFRPKMRFRRLGDER